MAEYVVAGQPLAIDGHAHQGGALGWAQAFASGHTSPCPENLGLCNATEEVRIGPDTSLISGAQPVA